MTADDRTGPETPDIVARKRVAPTRLETARLTGERATISHRSYFDLVWTDSRVTDWLWPGDLGGPRNPRQIDDALQRVIDRWSTEGYGAWVFKDNETSNYVGHAGLAPIVINGQSEIELAYAVLPEHWGHGYATEIASALVDTAFDELALERLVTFTLTTNGASQRVMEKAGFSYLGPITHVGLPHVLYQLDRRDRLTAARNRKGVRITPIDRSSSKHLG